MDREATVSERLGQRAVAWGSISTQNRPVNTLARLLSCPRSPAFAAKALFGACSARSAALTHALGTLCCCDWRALQDGLLV